MARPLSAALVVFLVAAGPAAADAESFGAPGRVLVWGAVALQNVSSDAPGSRSVTTLELSPGAQLFVAKNVAVGAELQILFATGGASLTSIGFLPSLGYNLDLAMGISWLPRVQLGVSSTSLSNGGSSVAVTRLSLGIAAPLIIRPAGNVFFGVGPRLLYDVAASASGNGAAARELIIGLQSSIGGWF